MKSAKNYIFRDFMDFSGDQVLPLYGLSKQMTWNFHGGSPSDPFDLNGAIDKKNSGVWDIKWLVKEIGKSGERDERVKDSEFCGLRNLGATCYVNAFVQSMFFIDEVREMIIRGGSDLEISSPLGGLSELFTEMKLSIRSWIDPLKFVDSCKLSHSTQEDAGEFSGMLINFIIDEIGRLQPELASQFSDLFFGKFRYTVLCKGCGSESIRTERFLEISCDFPSDAKIGSSFKMEDLLKNSYPEESIEGYACDTCKKRCEAIRKMEISQLPPYLRISLNRYKFEEEGRRKLNFFVDFPLINLSFTDSETFSYSVPLLPPNASQIEYDCVAVLQHHSSNASSGHYTALCRSNQENSDLWLQLDDKSVLPHMWTKRKNRKSEDLGDLTRAESSTGYLFVYCLKGRVENSRSAEGNPAVISRIEKENEILREEISSIESKRKLRDESAVTRRSAHEEFVKFLDGLKSKNVDNLVFVSAMTLRDWTFGRDLVENILNCKENQVPSFPKELQCTHGRLNPLSVVSGRVKVLPLDITPKEIPCLTIDEGMCQRCCTEESNNFQNLCVFEDTLRRVESLKLHASGINGNRLAFVNKFGVDKDIPDERKQDHAWIGRDNGLPKPIVNSKTMTEDAIPAAIWKEFIRKREKVSGQDTIDVESLSRLNLADGISCSHGNIRPNPEKYGFLVPLVIVNQLLEFSSVLVPAGLSDTIVIDPFLHGSDDICEICLGLSNDKQAARNRQKSKCGNLFSFGPNSQLPGNEWFLLPRTWWRTWRNWVDRGGKEPLKLNKDTIKEFICEHGELMIEISTLAESTKLPAVGSVFAGLVATGVGDVVLVSQDEFSHLSDEWGESVESMKVSTDPFELGIQHERKKMKTDMRSDFVRVFTSKFSWSNSLLDSDILSCKTCIAKRLEEIGENLLARKDISVREKGEIGKNMEICRISGLRGSMSGTEIKSLIVAGLADRLKRVDDISSVNLYLEGPPPTGLRITRGASGLAPLKDDRILKEVVEIRWGDWAKYREGLNRIQVILGAPLVDIPRTSRRSTEAFWQNISDLSLSPVKPEETGDGGLVGSVFRDISRSINFSGAPDSTLGSSSLEA